MSLLLIFTAFFLATLAIETDAVEFRPLLKDPFHARPGYGVIFRPMHKKFIPTESLTHVFFQLDFPTIPVLPDVPPLLYQTCFVQGDTTVDSNFQPTVNEVRTQLLLLGAGQTIGMGREPVSRNNADIFIAAARARNRSPLQALQINEEVKRRKDCAALMKELNQTVIRYNTLRHDITRAYTGLQFLLQSNTVNRKSAARTTRAILSFLSPAFENIFGFAQVDQVKAIQNNLLILQKNQYGISNDTEKIYSKLSILSNITSRRIDLIWDALNVQDSNINATITAFEGLASDVARTLIKFGHGARHMHDWAMFKQSLHERALLLLIDGMLIKNKLSVWTRSMEQLIKGYLPEEIITPFELKSALDKATEKLRTNHATFQLVHDVKHLHYYYSQRLTTLFITHNEQTDRYTIRIHMKVPISTMERSLDIFQVLSVPVPIHGQTPEPEQGYTKLKVPMEYFAVSLTQSTFTELSTQDYTYCTSLLDNTCPTIALNRDRTDLTCLAALYYNVPEQIKILCSFEYFPLSTAPTYAIFITEGTYLLATKTAELIFQCPGYAKRTHNTYFAVVEVPCACSVSSSGIFIPPSLANCAKTSVTIEVAYPINLIQAEMFGLDIKQMLINQAQEPFQPPTFHTAPMIDLASSTGLRYADEMLKLDLETREVGIMTTRTKLEDIKAIKYGSDYDWQWIHTIVHYTLEALTIITCLFLGVQVYKLRIVLLANIPQVSAYAVTILPTQPEPVTNTIQECYADLYLLVLLVTLAVILLLGLVYIVYRVLGRARPIKQEYAETKISLVFTNLQETKTIPLTIIPDCLLRIELLDMPAVSQCNYSSAFQGQCVTDIQWTHTLGIKALGINRDFLLPTKCTLPRKLARGLYFSSRMPSSIAKPQSVAVVIQASCDCTCHTTKQGLAKIIRTLPHQPTHTTLVLDTGLAEESTSTSL